LAIGGTIVYNPSLEHTYANEVVERGEYYIDSLEYNGHKYEIVKPITKTKISWYEAEKICEGWNGHLVTVTSSDEQTFLQNYIDKNYGENAMNNYWIGGYRDTDLNEWKWVTGEKWDYTNWASNEPNNYGGYIESYAHFVGKYYTSSKTVGKWNDASDSGAGYANSFFNADEYGFICEYDDYNASSSYITCNVTFPSYIEQEKDIKSTYYYRDDYFMSDSKMRKNVKTKIIKKYKKTSISINKLVSKKKYYVKISTYKKVKGKKYYSSWSKMKEVRIK